MDFGKLKPRITQFATGRQEQTIIHFSARVGSIPAALPQRLDGAGVTTWIKTGNIYGKLLVMLECTKGDFGLAAKSELGNF